LGFLSEDIKLLIEFSVLKDCAVPILLGLDVFQILMSTLDYEHEIWSFRAKKKSLAFQLYSKETLSAQFLDHYADVMEPMQKLLRKGVPWN
jgi:hypothetical protein